MGNLKGESKWNPKTKAKPTQNQDTQTQNWLKMQIIQTQNFFVDFSIGTFLNVIEFRYIYATKWYDV